MNQVRGGGVLRGQDRRGRSGLNGPVAPPESPDPRRPRGDPLDSDAPRTAFAGRGFGEALLLSSLAATMPVLPRITSLNRVTPVEQPLVEPLMHLLLALSS